MKLNLLDDLGDAFSAVSKVEDDYSSKRKMSLIARKLQAKLPHLYGEREVLDDPREVPVAARSGDSHLLESPLTYPSEVSSIEAFFG